MAEAVRLAVTVTLRLGQGDGALVALDRLGMLAEVVVGVSEAVKRRGLAAAVAELAVQVKGLLTVGKGLRVQPELRVAPADPVQRPGLPDQVPGGAEQVQGRERVPDRVSVPALMRTRPSWR
jgi:hypothetical protein